MLQSRLDFLSDAGSPVGVGQLASDSGMPPNRVTATLAGKRVPTREELHMLALALRFNATERVLLQDIRTREESGGPHPSVGLGSNGTGPRFTAAPREVASPHPDPPRRDIDARRPQTAPRTLAPEPVPAFGQPDPIRVSSPEELIQALNAVHIWAGKPSLRELERRTKLLLRRSSISDMLRGSTLPDYDRFVAFLKACSVQGTHLDTWVFVWRRLKALETPGAANWMFGTEDITR